MPTNNRCVGSPLFQMEEGILMSSLIRHVFQAGKRRRAFRVPRDAALLAKWEAAFLRARRLG